MIQTDCGIVTGDYFNSSFAPRNSSLSLIWLANQRSWSYSTILKPIITHVTVVHYMRWSTSLISLIGQLLSLLNFSCAFVESSMFPSIHTSAKRFFLSRFDLHSLIIWIFYHRNIVYPIVIKNNHKFLLLPDILCNALLLLSSDLQTIRFSHFLLLLSLRYRYFHTVWDLLLNWYTCWHQWQSHLR